MSHNNSDIGRQRLFERGQVRLEQENQTESAEVSRGMVILTRDGWEAGKVAAVVFDSQSRQVSHVLLGRPRLAPDYRLVPVELIKEVNGKTIYLLIDGDAVGSLALHQKS
jgi:uncharacterized protein YrrD